MNRSLRFQNPNQNTPINLFFLFFFIVFFSLYLILFFSLSFLYHSKTMKKISNSTYSSPPSSSSTTSLDQTMCNSKGATAGCLSAILRRILCSGGLPTHPSDQIRELDSNSIVGSSKDQNFKAKHHANATSTSTSTSTTTTTTSTSTSTSTSTTTPNIVARLMGLDSMVEAPSSSLSRSKSLNSVDYLGECNRMDGLHKRVNSTLSFREVPTFLLLENDNFFVLSFETGRGEGGKESKFKSSGRRREMGCAELKQRERKERVELSKENKKEKGCDEKGKMSKRVVCDDASCGSVGNGGKLKEITSTCPSNHFKAFSELKKKKCFDSEARKLSQHKNRKEVVAGEKMKRRRRRKKKTSCCTEKNVETECKSEQDSSPVSVLDFEREPCGTVGLSSRRKLSPELENDQLVLLRSDGNLMVGERKVSEIENNKCEGSKGKGKHVQEYIDIWGQVCKIAEDELAGSNQIHAWMNKQDGLGSIGADFESQIFGNLLNELIDQLVEDPVTTWQLEKL